MGERTHSGGGQPKPPPEEVEVVLAASKQKKDEAERVIKRNEESTVDMSRVLRRIAFAMESNPQSWDELFRGRGS